jgi:hypothetical protein
MTTTPDLVQRKPEELTFRLLGLGILLGTLGTLGGCAGLTPAQIDVRDAQRFEFRQQFHALRQQCHARGGRIYISAQRTVGRDGVPRRGDRYYCGPWWPLRRCRK